MSCIPTASMHCGSFRSSVVAAAVRAAPPFVRVTHSQRPRLSIVHIVLAPQTVTDDRRRRRARVIEARFCTAKYGRRDVGRCTTPDPSQPLADARERVVRRRCIDAGATLRATVAAMLQPLAFAFFSSVRLCGRRHGTARLRSRR